MQLTFLGTCSGTEPVRGYRHVSFTVRHKDRIFFFDAGEGSSCTAHLLGINLLHTRAVFISHCHMDHVGGLENLLWTIRKLDGVSEEEPSPMAEKTVDVVIPDENSWEGIIKVLNATEGGFKTKFKVKMSLPGKGEIYRKDGFKVSALPNRHLGQDEKGRSLSFSYKIEAEGRSIVYSGDVKDVSELEPLLDNCSLLLMETGHHRAEEVCSYVKEKAPGVENLGFIHHGRAILASPETELNKAREILGDTVFIARDRTAVEV